MMVSQMEVRVDLNPQGLLRDRARVTEHPKGWVLFQQTEKVGGGIDLRRQNMNKGPEVNAEGAGGGEGEGRERAAERKEEEREGRRGSGRKGKDTVVAAAAWAE